MVADGEYLFLYNSNQIEDKKALGYVLALETVAVNERDIHKDHLTPMQIAEIAEALDVSISDLYIDKLDSTFEQFTDDDLVRVLAKDPTKMKTPIILSTKTSFFVSSSYELIKEKLEVNGINESMANRSES